MSDKTNELLLIETRGDAPLVRTTIPFDGNPAGTLGYIVGVDGNCIRVQLASGGEPVLLPPTRFDNV